MIEPKIIENLLSQVRKPGQYIGNEWNSVKKNLDEIPVKFALAFPDLYEVGMSHLGLKLLYHLLNEDKEIACERTFSPAADLEELLRKEKVPLFSLESKEPLSNFDIIGFSLTYELNYTNVLNILNLAGIPLKRDERDGSWPLVIAGGPAAFNPEPMSDFIDLFVIGEAEEAIIELIRAFKTARDASKNKTQILKTLSSIEGVYVPSLYSPGKDTVPAIKKRYIRDLNNSFYPVKQIVPHINVIHDRLALEIMRGCPNICRFCQARSIYHHKRERSLKKILELAEKGIANTGYEEISLLSLSSGDHSQIAPMIDNLISRFKKNGISISLPSLRIEKLLKSFPDLLSRIRKSGLTFAPEAGSERLRKIINKNINMDELGPTIKAACDSGWRRVKLYFMIGLPTETYEDIDGIIDTIYSILKDNRNIELNVSISSFIPKPHTQFQRSPMEREEALRAKISYIASKIKPRRAKLKFHDTRTGMLEAVFSRGDRKLGSVILHAFKSGCRFDSWKGQLDFDRWTEAFNAEGINLEDYIYRTRPATEHLPWDHINCGTSL